MNLFDRYIAELGRNLPEKNRADIQKEVRSTLEDIAEERSASSGKPVDDALMRDVLLDYGSPEKVAAQYQPNQYLIGPDLYPAFHKMLTILLAVVVALTLIGIVFDLAFPEGKPVAAFDSILAAFGELLSNFVLAFGLCVALFALIERKRRDKGDSRGRKWNPDRLSTRLEIDSVDKSDEIATIVFILIGLFLLNFAPKFGLIVAKTGDEMFNLPLNDVFYQYIPWIIGLGMAQIALSFFLIFKGYWSTLLRIAELALNVLSLALILVMMNGPELIQTGQLDLAAAVGAESTFLQRFLQLLPQGTLLIILLVILIIVLVDTVKGVVRLIRKR